jgi:hypothetical protein
MQELAVHLDKKGMNSSAKKTGIWKIAVISLVLLSVGLIFNRPKPIYQQPTQKIIERRIEIRENNIDKLLQQASLDRNVINSISKQLASFKWQLNNAKIKRDTAAIVKHQDQIIQKQDTAIATYETMDKKKDSVISEFQHISKSKDTIIDLKNYKIKKKNRTITGLVIYSILATAGIIIK